MAKIALANVCADKEGNLVSDLDPRAAILVAVAGQAMPQAAIEKYPDDTEFFVEPTPAIKDENPLPESLLSDNLSDTVSKLSGPGLAKLRSRLTDQFGARLQSTGDAANPEQKFIIFQTLGASPENPILVEFEQFILESFTGSGKFDLIERDAIRRVFDGASAGGTPVVGSATMDWSAEDVGASIKVGLNPGRHYIILSVEDPEHVTLNGNITLPSSALILTMDGMEDSEVTIATKDGFPDVDAIDGWSSRKKPLTSDKVYFVDFVPGTTGDGIYSVPSCRALYHIDPVPQPADQ